MLTKSENLIENYQNDENFLSNEIWKTIGFQSEKPQRDFRGGGLMSLYNLLFFSHYHQYSVQNIKTYCTSNDSFLFACVLISTLFWLKHFFHFDRDELTLFKGVDAIRSSRKGLKYFLSFSNKNGSNNVYNGEEVKNADLLRNEKQQNPDSEKSSAEFQQEQFENIFSALFQNNEKYISFLLISN